MLYLIADVVDPEKIALKIGDKVIVNLPLKNFMEMQKDPIYGGWDDGLGQVSNHSIIQQSITILWLRKAEPYKRLR